MRYLLLTIPFFLSPVINLSAQSWSLDTLVFDDRLEIAIEAELADRLTLEVLDRWGQTILTMLDSFEVRRGETFLYEFDQAASLVFFLFSSGEGRQIEKVVKMNDATAQITVNIQLLDSGLRSGEMSLYPNPVADDLLNLQYVDEADSYRLDLFDEAGRLWRQEKGEKPFLLTRELDLSALPAGVYFIRLTAGGRELTEKFIKH